jgi:hypothetical protein
MDIEIIALIFYTGVLVLSLLLLLYARRLLLWSERTFTPSLKKFVDKSNSAIESTPHGLFEFGVWFIRVFGIVGALGSIAVLYGIITDLFF